MNKVSKLFLIAAAGLFFVGCYNDYRNPKAAKIYTRADFEKEGLEYISIKDLKAQFKAENPGMNDGTVVTAMSINRSTSTMRSLNRRSSLSSIRATTFSTPRDRSFSSSCRGWCSATTAV